MVLGIQSASMWKRISAALLDLILLCVLASGFMLVISAATGYDSYSEKLDELYSEYAAEYGFETLDITEEEYNKMSKEEQDAFNAAGAALMKDKEAIYNYNMVANLTLVITSLGILFSIAVLEFVVPLIFKNGQTVGKKIFALAVCRRDGIKMTTFMLAVRVFLGKFTVEVMLPVLLVLLTVFGSMGLTSLIFIVALLIFELALMLSSPLRTTVHDAFAQTVVVDLPTQRIFDSTEEQTAFLARIAAEEAKNAEYR